MIASGSSIVALLPYIQQLIYGYNLYKTCTSRVHFIWQIETPGKPWNNICLNFHLPCLNIGDRFQRLLDKALNADTKKANILKRAPVSQSIFILNGKLIYQDSQNINLY